MNSDDENKNPQDDPETADETQQGDTPEFDADEVQNDPARNPDDERYKGIKGG
jgi:hypothetical protein